MAAITAAVMAGTMAAGIATQAYGASKQYEASKEQAAASKAIYGDEIQQDALRRQAMELSADRQSKEIVRNAQRARAMSLNATTTQGGQTGNVSSALGGSYGQESGQTNTNLLGLYQNLQLGRNMFDLNSLINQQKMVMADASSKMALGQGISGIGGGLVSSAGAFGNLSNGFGFGNQPSAPSGGFTTGAP